MIKIGDMITIVDTDNLPIGSIVQIIDIKSRSLLKYKNHYLMKMEDKIKYKDSSTLVKYISITTGHMWHDLFDTTCKVIRVGGKD